GAECLVAVWPPLFLEMIVELPARELLSTKGLPLFRPIVIDVVDTKGKPVVEPTPLTDGSIPSERLILEGYLPTPVILSQFLAVSVAIRGCCTQLCITRLRH